MVLPRFSGRRASCTAAQTAAPEEMPTSTPSSRPSRPAHGQGVLVLHLDDLVIDPGVQRLRDEAGPDALDGVGPRRFHR